MTCSLLIVYRLKVSLSSLIVITINMAQAEMSVHQLINAEEKNSRRLLLYETPSLRSWVGK